MQLPTVKQLRFLVALDEYRHFGKAAANCHISQSAFSIAIKELEKTLNVHLVDRTNKRVAFTDIGRSVVDQARHCIGDMETLVNIASRRHEPLTGRLALGVIPTIAPFLLPAVLPEINARYPNLQLYLREDKTCDVYQQLLEGKLDLILVALPFKLDHVDQMVLFDDPFLLACRRGTRWLKTGPRKKFIDLLPPESVLLLDDGHCLRDHALQACKLHDTDQISRFSATSLQTLLQMVAADLGATFIPAMARDSLMVSATRLELHELPKESMRHIGLAWRKGSSRAEEFTLFGRLLRELYRQSKP